MFALIDFLQNTIDSNTLNSESVFMNINNEFMMMRNPVTNRQFLNFLNTNQQLNVDLVNILWTDVDTDINGQANPWYFVDGEQSIDEHIRGNYIWDEGAYQA